jgi:hypothetical protein
MRPRLLRPLTPIFDVEKSEGQILVGDTPNFVGAVDEFFDDFNRADGAPGSDWAAGATIASNTLDVGGGAFACATCTLPITSTNMFVETEASWNLSNNNAPVIRIRRNGSNGYYELCRFDQPAYIARINGGTTTVLNTGGTISGSPLRIRGEIWNSGSTVRIDLYEVTDNLVNGTKALLASITDSSVDRVVDGSTFSVCSWTSSFEPPRHDNVLAGRLVGYT